MWPFAPRLPIDRDEFDWQLAAHKWMDEEFAIGDRGLVEPTAAFFPPSTANGKVRAAELFDQVRVIAHMSDWPCRLVAGSTNRSSDAGNTHLLRHQGPSAPCGTFRAEFSRAGFDAVITYDPALVAEPVVLIATFAHELAHYLMKVEASSAPPGSWEMEEHLTDLLSVRMGFGLFLANSARAFKQFQNATEMGWSSQARGYLSEQALVTALAVCELRAGRDPMAAAAHLKPYLAGDMRKAARAIGHLHPDLDAAIGGIDLDAFVRD